MRAEFKGVVEEQLMTR